MTTLSYDRTGKIVLDDIYNQPDPTAYFSTLHELDYRIPGEAKPYFRRLLEARRVATGKPAAKVIDVGCSYGVNAALLRHDISLDELFSLYDGSVPLDAQALLARDAELFGTPQDTELEVVGVDIADRALAYAVDAGVLDAGVAANLELREPTADNRAVLGDADLVISTGCVGYVTDTSIERIVAPSMDNRPWLANFVLRMFDYEPIDALMADHDYMTEKLDGALFPQRRFASAEERTHVLDNLARRGVSAADAEEEGWYFAELYVSRPREHASGSPLKDVLDSVPSPERPGLPISA